MSRPQGSRPLSGPARFLIAVAALFALGLAAGAGVGFLSDLSGSAAVVATAGLIAVTMAVALGGCVWWWARLDEAAREAHKWAWWWGGSAGMAVGLVLLLTLVTHEDAAAVLAWAGDTPADIFGAGMMAILLFQLAGYAIAWSVWWLTRMRG